MGAPVPLPHAVLHVLHGWPPASLGGTELYVQALLRALGRRVPAHGLALDGPGRPVGERLLRLEAPGGPGGHLLLLRPPPPRRQLETFRSAWVEERFARWLRATRPAVVHFHHLSGLSLALPRLAAASGARVVFTLHDYHLACARGQLLDAGLAPCPGPGPERCAACLGGQLALSPLTAPLGRLASLLPDAWRPLLRQRLAPRPGAAPGESWDSPPRSPAGRLAARRLQAALEAARQVDLFLSPSRDLARRFRELGLPGRVEVLDLPLPRPVPPAPPPGEGPVRFLFVGALHPSKGPHLLLEAFARLPAGAATLLLAGPRPPVERPADYARRLEARARELPGVRLLPPFPPERLPALLAGADVLVLPSLWPENSPLVVREARAAGLRVVAPVRGGARELASDLRLVEPREPGALLRALREELRLGRGRLPPLRYPAPGEHAEALLRLYGEVSGFRFQVSGGRGE